MGEKVRGTLWGWGSGAEGCDLGTGVGLSTMEYSGLGWELTHLLDNPRVGGGYRRIAQMGKPRRRGPVLLQSDIRKWQPQRGQREREGETETF